MLYIYFEHYKGIDGIGLETIDPMKLNKLKIVQGDVQAPVSINSSFSKATVAGFAETKILSNKYEFEKWLTRLLIVEKGWQMKENFENWRFGDVWNPNAYRFWGIPFV